MDIRGGSFGTTSLVSTILQESIGSWLNRCTSSMLPTRDDAKVHEEVMSNLPFASFSITDRVASAAPKLCPVTIDGRFGRSSLATEGGAIPRSASRLIASCSSWSANETLNVSGGAPTARAVAPGRLHFTTFRVL